MKKTLITILATVLVCCCVAGTTYAWLVAKTDPIVNTFTYGNIKITLKESDNLDLKMVPGALIEKDPEVTVVSGSEDCWLFIKIDKGNNFDYFMTFEIADGWTHLDGVDGVYYRQVTSASEDQLFGVIKDDTVTVKSTVTTEDLNALDHADKMPTLTLTAYAVQLEGFVDTVEGKTGVQRAWEEAKKLDYTIPDEKG